MQKDLVGAALFGIGPGMRKFLALVLALSPLKIVSATTAPDCAPYLVDAPIEAGLRPLERVADYRPTLKSCRTDAGGERLAIRTMRVDGEDLLLTVDPQRLDTRLDRAACLRCDGAEPQLGSRFLRAVEANAARGGKKLRADATWLDNAGLTTSHDGEGAFVTGDLCPSLRPLDRAFLQSLEKPASPMPIALSISGLWIMHHAEDFAWLRREKAEGRLDITFVNHSFNHSYQLGLPDSENFLLMPGTDPEHEILDVERLLIANGETPSAFFRFPGLISDARWMENLRKDHLIPLGAAAWLALSQKPDPGAIVLVHPNGNEPLGLSDFKRLREKNALPQPFRPLIEAP
jgi:hypothetical protein